MLKIEPAERLKALPPYLFVEIDRRKREALAAGRDVIDFGVGDPDEPTPAFIRERMHAAVDIAEHHRYPLGRGNRPYRDTIAAFFKKRYDVSLDPEREILALIGSKEGIGHLPLALVNPGEVVIVPQPGYPVYHAGTLFAGGQPWTLELSDKDGWLPDLGRIPADVARAARLMFLNYPNNPTGALAPRSLFEEVVAYCRQHDILLAHDAAYNEMYFGEPPLSVMQIDGAREVAIELHSASKSFNMTGWRVGFAVGHPEALAALAKIKSNVDSGVFGAVQEAAMAAYGGFDRQDVRDARAVYHERVEVLSAGLRSCGFAIEPPAATFYVWAGVPAGYDSTRLVTKLLDEANVVCIPGAGFGANCDKYVRFACTVPMARIKEAIERIKALSW